jgi:hypothetical protein
VKLSRQLSPCLNKGPSWCWFALIVQQSLGPVWLSFGVKLESERQLAQAKRLMGAACTLAQGDRSVWKIKMIGVPLKDAKRRAPDGLWL